MRSIRAAAAHRASYAVELVAEFVLLVDLDEGGPSVTNDAENVIADLVRGGALDQGARVLYRDTLGGWDELLHDGVRFAAFRAIGGVDPEDAIRKARRV